MFVYAFVSFAFITAYTYFFDPYRDIRALQYVFIAMMVINLFGEGTDNPKEDKK